MSNFSLRGTYTALVTPFKADGSVDFEKLNLLLDKQIEGGVTGVVVCGTTGESATLSMKEKLAIIIHTVEYCAKKIQVIAGTGSNNTKETVDLTLLAKEHGVDAVLIVAPYYNKPTQEGLYNHYAAIAEQVDIPQILYNVPGRTSVNISAETQIRLASAYSNIVATKEASGNLEQIMQIIQNAPDGFYVLSGDDSLTLPIVLMGGSGVIAVTSNYAPKQLSDMVRLALAGDYEGAVDIHYKIFDLMKLNFIESNPTPCKAILNLMGLIDENLRLPLLPITPNNKAILKDALEKAALL